MIYRGPGRREIQPITSAPAMESSPTPGRQILDAPAPNVNRVIKKAFPTPLAALQGPSVFYIVPWNPLNSRGLLPWRGLYDGVLISSVQ
jgi:hypothetical protein